jgi:hypothetical protein
MVTSMNRPSADTVPLPAAAFCGYPAEPNSTVPPSPASSQVVTFPVTSRGAGAGSALATPLATTKPVTPKTARPIVAARSRATDRGAAHVRTLLITPYIGVPPKCQAIQPDPIAMVVHEWAR